MSGRVLEMEKTHIVYKFYEGDRAANVEDDKFFLSNKIIYVPVIVVFNQGKEVKRYTGIESIEKILVGVKTKKVQRGSWYPDWLKLW